MRCRVVQSFSRVSTRLAPPGDDRYCGTPRLLAIPAESSEISNEATGRAGDTSRLLPDFLIPDSRRGGVPLPRGGPSPGGPLKGRQIGPHRGYTDPAAGPGIGVRAVPGVAMRTPPLGWAYRRPPGAVRDPGGGYFTSLCIPLPDKTPPARDYRRGGRGRRAAYAPLSNTTSARAHHLLSTEGAPRSPGDDRGAGRFQPSLRRSPGTAGRSPVAGSCVQSILPGAGCLGMRE